MLAMTEPAVEHDLGQPGITNDVNSLNDSYYSSSDDETPLKCFECEVEFTGKKFLHNHLLHHIKQPWVSLSRVQLAPIKITLKSTSANNFEIVSSPQASPKIDDPQDTAYEATEPSAEDEDNEEHLEHLETEEEEEEDEDSTDQELGEESPAAHNESEGVPDDEDGSEEIMTNVRFSPTFIGDGLESENSQDEEVGKQTEYNHIPGAEPTPPPEPSPEYPKIRIKSGLLKEPLTITEITDDNPNGDYNQTEYNSECTHWATPSLEDPLRLPETGENDSSILSNLFTNNNDRAKDLGFTTSDPEFISLDSSSRTSNNALQVFNSTANSASSNNPLDTLSNLPMQQLAQQVSRLQPSGNNGMHQQNVLINIQQFPQAPPPQPHPYQQVMYPPHPPQPMYHQPYQYQPPNQMYYPQTPAYSHMPPPPRPQMPPPGQQMPQNQQQQQQQQQQANNQQVQYRQPMQAHPRQQQQQPLMVPRQGGPGSRGGMTRGAMQMGPRGGYGTRQPLATRQRAPMSRGRGGGLIPGIRGPRARMAMPNGSVMTQNGPRMMKRPPEIVQNMQTKRKKIDVLVPDKHDDADCQVIAVQPKNTGLPQIQSIQGNCQEPTDNNIMHLSDSITLSVRNPPQKPPSPKKSDAKDVANILATRGITVTATPKSKENKQQEKSSEPPVAINLNSSVCIIPTNKKPSEKMTTVDLTEEPEPPPPPSAPKQHLPKQHTSSNKVLPFQCDLCPAKYPNSFSLSKHRQTFHKTGSSADYGVPLIDLRTPGIMQRLASLGIHNYIPLPGANPESTFALPIINSNTYKNGNLNAIGATSVLTLGPIRMFRAAQANSK